MRSYRFKPKWRQFFSDDAEITVVEDPDRGWFDNLTPMGGYRIARFALLQDGGFRYGDAYTVLHQDIKGIGRRIVNPDSGWEDCIHALVGGSLVWDRTHWRIGILQFYGHNLEGSMVRFRPLAGRLSTWLDLVEVLGEDPLDHPPMVGGDP